MQTRAGTAFYMAPEVLTKNYNNLCDMWSVGVILYILLCGYPPFYGDDDKEILEAAAKGEFDFNDEIWDEVSAEAKDLIKQLLCPQDKRLTAKQAIKHPWLQKYTGDEKMEPTKFRIDKLKNFNKTSKLKKAVLTYMASRCTDEEIRYETNMFLDLDKSKRQSSLMFYR